MSPISRQLLNSTDNGVAGTFTDLGGDGSAWETLGEVTYEKNH